MRSGFMIKSKVKMRKKMNTTHNTQDKQIAELSEEDLKQVTGGGAIFGGGTHLTITGGPSRMCLDSDPNCKK